MILFDTNILVYSQDKDDRRYKISLSWMKKAEKKEVAGIISSQNIVESASVLFNLSRISKTYSDIIIREKISNILMGFQSGLFNIIYPNHDTIIIFNKLIKQYDLTPRKIYDTFLVATMLSNNIREILTFNTADFEKYREIRAIKPE